MIISFFRTALILVLIVVLSGCGWFGKSETEYAQSVEHEPLNIPEGLDRPRGSSPPVIISSPDMRKPVGDELEPLPPRVASASGTHNAVAYMAWSANGVYLFLKDTPEIVAVMLYRALEKEGMTLLEDSITGAYKFHYKQTMSNDGSMFSNVAFWRDRPFDYSGTFMTNLVPDGENTRVYLLFGTGETVDTQGAEHVLGELLERME